MKDIKKKVEKKNNVVLEFAVNDWGGEELVEKKWFDFEDGMREKFVIGWMLKKKNNNRN